MSLTDAQKSSRLFKKSLGAAETLTARDFFEEPKLGKNSIYPSQIWTETEKIPIPAPILSSGQTLGVVQYFEKLSLTHISGSQDRSYTHENLKNTIPFNYESGGTYNYQLFKSDGITQIAFGQGDWLLDTDAGVLTFYGTLPTSVTSSQPPQISFYKYIGQFGFSTGTTSGVTEEIAGSGLTFNIDEKNLNVNVDNTTIKIVNNEIRTPINYIQNSNNSSISGITGSTNIILTYKPIDNVIAYINGIEYLVSTYPNSATTNMPFFFINYPPLQGDTLNFNTSIADFIIEPYIDLITIKYNYIIDYDQLIPETIFYKNRVEADGGIINDIIYTNNIFKKIKELNISTSGIIGLSTLAGIKYSGSTIEKRYNLFSTNDEIQDTPSLRYSYIDDDYFYGKSAMFDESKCGKISSLTLPTYIDVFLVGSFSKQWMIEHSPNASANQGFNFWGGKVFNAWYVRRTSSQSTSVQSYEWGVGRCVNRFIYNNTNNKYYRNKIQITGTTSGSIQPNSNITNQLNIFSRNQVEHFSLGRNKDIFIFSELSKTNSDLFEDYLYSTINSDLKTDINLLTDGDSLSLDWLTATTSYPSELISNMLTTGKTILNNVAVAGQKSDNSTGMLVNFQSHLDSTFNSSMTNNICIIQIGINDMLASVSVNTIYNNIITAVNLANIKGFKTFVITNRLIANASVTTSIQQLNNLILNNSVVSGYTAIDIASYIGWNTFDKTSDTNYYVDGLHLTNKAHRIVAKLVYDVIINHIT
jgi:lysophospholipase L1-like esterase